MIGQAAEFPPGSTQFTFDHSCADDDPSGTTADSYRSNLKLTDDEGAFATETAEVKVHNVAPTIDAGPAKAARTGEPVTFTASITDPGIADTHTVTWNFADASPPADGLEVTHIFKNPGQYTVTVNVEDDDGDHGQDTVGATVSRGMTTLHLPLTIKP